MAEGNLNMAEGNLIAALNAALAPRGIKLEFRDGDLWIGARPDAERQRFEAEYGETIQRLRKLLKGQSLVQEPAATPSNHDVPERWLNLNTNHGLDAMMNHAMGGSEPAAVPVARVAIAPSIAKREEYKRAPMHAGVYIATPTFQGWREQWRQAMNRGENQDEWLAAHPAPYRFPGDGGP
jgi:hypothetical protein